MKKKTCSSSKIFAAARDQVFDNSQIKRPGYLGKMANILALLLLNHVLCCHT